LSSEILRLSEVIKLIKHTDLPEEDLAKILDTVFIAGVNKGKREQKITMNADRGWNDYI